MLPFRKPVQARQILSFTQRHCSTSPYNLEAIDKWISQPERVIRSATLHAEHLSDLYITLPTRDGTRRPSLPPASSSPVEYGHHLAFFHSRTPESQLRDDGTDPEFCAPEPFTRRMWGGGKMAWNNENPLLVGRAATSSGYLARIEKKGFDDPRKRPMLVVNQRIDITVDGKNEPSVSEERSHVYFADTTKLKREARDVKDLPLTPDFTFTYTPSLTTLFRFSALTFNAHHIHLDQEFSQKKQGYPERLVHGPLTALMLLETTAFNNPGIRLRSFEYRAQNPIIVNHPTTICGTWQGNNTIRLWCVDEDGVVGMTGTVEVL